MPWSFLSSTALFSFSFWQGVKTCLSGMRTTGASMPQSRRYSCVTDGRIGLIGGMGELFLWKTGFYRATRSTPGMAGSLPKNEASQIAIMICWKGRIQSRAIALEDKTRWFEVKYPLPSTGGACKAVSSKPELDQLPGLRAGRRYAGVFMFVPAGDAPACRSTTWRLNRRT